MNKPVKSPLKKIWVYFTDYKFQIIFLISLSILGNFLTLLGPYLIGRNINIMKINMTQDQHKELILTSIILVASYLLGTFFTYIQTVKTNYISRQIVYKMRKDSFNCFHKFSINYFDKSSSGNILSIIINDIDNISGSISQIGNQIITSMLTIVVALCIMFFINPTLTIVQLILFFIIGAYIRKINRISKVKLRLQQSFLGKLSGYTEEILLGQKEVKIFSHEECAIKKFEKLNKIYKKNAIRAQFLLGLNYPSILFISNISYILIIVLGSYFIIQNKISLGGLLSFIIYSKMFNRPVANISEIYGIIQSVFVSIERFFSFVEQEKEPTIGTKTVYPESIKGEISFENVFFSYDKDRNTIEDLNFHVNPGDTISIVGPTGAGKTTLVNLIMRFYEIDSGSIKLDGIDIREYSKSQFRELFGMVLQDTWLFSGTIRENISYGNENISDDLIIEAAKKACAHDFIIKLPQGYDTVISEDNTLLSYGQKQLLTIARVVVSNPKFLILDEATSGIDTRTEKRLQNAMSNVVQNRTSFIIAHRLSTIRNATLIIVVDNGTVVEVGTHNELLNKKGFYYNMYIKQ